MGIRLHSAVTVHASNEKAAKLTRVQKEQPKEALNKPFVRSGIREEFWDAGPCMTW